MLDTVKPQIKQKSEKQEKSFDEPLIFCKKCYFILTRQSFASSPEGYHEHMQCNPSGLTFVFRCFSRAPGCNIRGKATSEFSWFQGYSWQYSFCQGCGEHLGWHFSNAEEDNFFGLIAKKITENRKAN